ncbi:MAG TPA: pyridoxal phosphate-dependent aminotransferase [Elusimicrobiota bacterium]|nr:pyridoxal phosphate-dependent aminotransferase [Elusimicrobiota bacterium]
MIFSSLVEKFKVPSNALYKEKDSLLSKGKKIIDCVSGNVSEQGISYPYSALEKIIERAGAQAKVYRPDPQGQPVARAAVSEFYKQQGVTVPPEHVLMTPGTSFSYWCLFRLFGNPGDEFLAPCPSYPLFDHIAAASGVQTVPYELNESALWKINLDDLESKVNYKTKGIILVSPHNPTGAVMTEQEIDGLVSIAERNSLPIIADEVFSPFLFRLRTLPRPASRKAPLVFTLNGFSKMFALPGMKIGWMAVTGKESLVTEAVQSLSTLIDAFLPVNEISQFAVPDIFREGAAFLSKYRMEISSRAEMAIRALSKVPRLTLSPPEGGFYLTLKVNDLIVDEEQLALSLLRQEGLLVHPGYFYDMAPAHLVISYVLSPDVLQSALKKLVKHFQSPA